MNELDISVEPADERRAAEIAQAFVEHDETAAQRGLTELADLGMESTLAVVALLARHLRVALVELLGLEGALRLLERTRLDAAVAE